MDWSLESNIPHPGPIDPGKRAGRTRPTWDERTASAHPRLPPLVCDRRRLIRARRRLAPTTAAASRTSRRFVRDRLRLRDRPPPRLQPPPPPRPTAAARLRLSSHLPPCAASASSATAAASASGRRLVRDRLRLRDRLPPLVRASPGLRDRLGPPCAAAASSATGAACASASSRRLVCNLLRLCERPPPLVCEVAAGSQTALTGKGKARCDAYEEPIDVSDDDDTDPSNSDSHGNDLPAKMLDEAMAEIKDSFQATQEGILALLAKHNEKCGLVFSSLTEGMQALAAEHGEKCYSAVMDQAVQANPDRSNARLHGAIEGVDTDDMLAATMRRTASHGGKGDLLGPNKLANAARGQQNPAADRANPLSVSRTARIAHHHLLKSPAQATSAVHTNHRGLDQGDGATLDQNNNGAQDKYQGQSERCETQMTKEAGNHLRPSCMSSFSMRTVHEWWPNSILAGRLFRWLEESCDDDITGWNSVFHTLYYAREFYDGKLSNVLDSGRVAALRRDLFYKLLTMEGNSAELPSHIARYLE
ncbi:hypothetical protein OsJ_19541 [Oryza sativa Japonica Group]|uniref:Uncharacterized protein n=1 Tax=Oryza sativa subsp. japonica TaxID=39947 RepID=B9FLL7_ORYSJ|nr:hypothetical protein OsJ_19541 [Oryza sativa Japonica Group]